MGRVAGQAASVELPAICRRFEAEDSLGAAHLVPSAVHFIENPGLLDRLGSWPPLARQFFIGQRALIGRPAGSPAAEGPLIQAFQSDRTDLRVAAANALGRVGSTSAVLPLKEAAERFSRDSELRRATRQAIAEIQSRLPGASPGQLSLAGAGAGQLSLAQADAGQLSLATDPAGQLLLESPEVAPGDA